jgi:hypothetical protein
MMINTYLMRNTNVTAVDYNQFKDMVRSGQIVRVEIQEGKTARPDGRREHDAQKEKNAKKNWRHPSACVHGISIFFILTQINFLKIMTKRAKEAEQKKNFSGKMGEARIMGIQNLLITQ